MKRIKPISLASVLLVSTLAASGAALAGQASTIAPDSGLDHGHQVPPQFPVQATYHSGIKLGHDGDVVTVVSDLASGSGVEAIQVRTTRSQHSMPRTSFEVEPLVSDSGLDSGV